VAQYTYMPLLLTASGYGGAGNTTLRCVSIVRKDNGRMS